MTPAAPRYLSAASSDTGYVRSNNEDRVYCDDVRGFFLVVDGMGGHEAGEHAAEIAVEHIRLRLERQTGAVEQRVREAITLANNAIYKAAEENPAWTGMACVLTLAVIQDGQVTIGHVGDSRLYRIQRGRIEKVTHDHSPVGEREDSGELTETEAMEHPRRNEVYRDVGSGEHAPGDDDFIELLQIPFRPDSALLLCSDGLSDALSSKEILATVEMYAGDRWATVRALVAAANENGKDNVSAVLIEGDEFAAAFNRRSSSAHRQPIVTDPPTGVITGRLTPAARPRSGSPFASAPAMAIYGAVLGGLLSLAAVRFLLSTPAPPLQTMFVAAPASIKAALDKAQPGLTIVVGPGIWREDLVLKSGVDVVAQRAHESVIEGSVLADGVRNSRLEGFNVRAASFGVRISNSDVELVRDDVAGASGAGIEFSGNSRGAVLACSVHNNPGPGIVIRDSATPAIENNVVILNGAGGGMARPGLLIEAPVVLRVARNVFFDNGAEAIWLRAPDADIERQNFFELPVTAATRRNVRILPPGEAARESR